MSRHLAPEELLLDYSSGALSHAPSLAVAVHLALVPEARRTVELLDAVGGALLENECAALPDDCGLERAMARLDSVACEPPALPSARRPGFEWAPTPLASYIRPGSGWRRILGKFDEIRLEVPGDAYRASLVRLEPGHSLPEHKHSGYEYTVCLQGGYTDATGSYGVGDFAVGPGAERHEPIADPGEPCIALIIVETPIVLTGPWRRWLNPLVSRHIV